MFPHLIPKAEGPTKRCASGAPGCKSSWAHGIHPDATRTTVCISQYTAFPHDLFALLPRPARTTSMHLHCAKSNETPPGSWGLLQAHRRRPLPGRERLEPRTQTQYECLHPPGLFTERLKYPYTKSPVKLSGVMMFTVLFLPSGLRCPLSQQTESPLSSVDMHVATSH